MRERFIYYRAAIADAPAVTRAVQAFQQRLVAAHPGLEARLLRRPEARDDLHTWMETYRRPRHADGIDDALAAAIEAEAAVLAPLLRGPRHVEAFDACAS